MLVTFRSPAYSDVTMFGDVALVLIQAMGHSATVPGALAAEDVGAALERLQAAVEERGQDPLSVEHAGGDDDDRSVTLARRALPLITLLAAAQRAGAYVAWDR